MVRKSIKKFEFCVLWHGIFKYLGGIFPFPGVTALIVLLLCYLFKANIPTAIAINYIMTPINLATFIPFINIGIKITRIDSP